MKYLRQQALDRLIQDVPINLERYRSGNFEYLQSDPIFYRDLDVDPHGAVDLTLDSAAEHDAFNAAKLWQAFSHLSAADGRDRRLWTMLSHTTFLPYARARYPIPPSDEEAIKLIRAHWFAGNNRALERDQAISRLWWFAFLANRTENLSLEDALNALLYRTDLRANLIERPTMAQCVPLFSAWLEVLHRAREEATDEEPAFYKRSVYRSALKRLNAFGGYRLLNSMTSAGLKELVTSSLDAASAEA